MTQVLHKNRLGELVTVGQDGGAVLVRFTRFVLEDDDGYHRAITDEEYVAVSECEAVVSSETVNNVTTVKLADGSVVLLGTTVVPGTEEADADDGGETVLSDGLDERERPARSTVRARAVRRDR